MGRLRESITVVLSSAWSTLLLRAYRRPLGFLLGLIAVPLVVIASATYAISTSLWRAQTLHNLGVTARLGAEIIAETLDESSRFAELLAAEEGLVDELRRNERENLAQRLKEALRFDTRLDLAVILAPTGSVLAASSDEPGWIKRDLSGQDAFLGARQGGWHPYVSSVYLQEGLEMEKVVSVAVPITEHDAVVGLLEVQHRVEQIKSWIQKLRVEPEGFLFVVDHRDQLVVYPFQVLPGRPKIVSHWPPVAYRVPPDGGALVFHDAQRGRRWLAGVHPVGETGWRVVAVQPERAAFQTLYRVFQTLGLLLLLLLVMTILVTLRWMRLHTLSLHLLRQNAKMLKQFQQQRSLDRSRPPERPQGKSPA